MVAAFKSRGQVGHRDVSPPAVELPGEIKDGDLETQHPGQIHERRFDPFRRNGKVESQGKGRQKGDDEDRRMTDRQHAHPQQRARETDFESLSGNGFLRRGASGTLCHDWFGSR